MRVSVTIQGVTPLLMNRFTEEAEVKVGAGTSTVMIGKSGTPREMAAPKCYADEAGNLFIPGPNIFSAIIAAGSFHKAGKKQLTTTKASLVPAGMSVDDLVCPLNTKQWEVDTRSIVNPATGGRRICHRPRLDSWEVTFNITIDTTFFDPKLVRALIDDAGSKIGLGDFRPSRKGPFGKFKVVKWQEIKEAKAA